MSAEIRRLEIEVGANGLFAHSSQPTLVPCAPTATTEAVPSRHAFSHHKSRRAVHRFPRLAGRRLFVTASPARIGCRRVPTRHGSVVGREAEGTMARTACLFSPDLSGPFYSTSTFGPPPPLAGSTAPGSMPRCPSQMSCLDPPRCIRRPYHEELKPLTPAPTSFRNPPPSSVLDRSIVNGSALGLTLAHPRAVRPHRRACDLRGCGAKYAAAHDSHRDDRPPPRLLFSAVTAATRGG
ncbi:hypothetical protein B0H13DRAFT_1908032 [Mycena leptocephala]|nr:hypothetical protein B0H13DRAFT_1908032 [Mycena leptocephala]